MTTWQIILLTLSGLGGVFMLLCSILFLIVLWNDQKTKAKYKDLPQHETMQAVSKRLAEARQKHPSFAEGKYHALGEIKKEFDEFSYAVEHEPEDRQRDEALDVIVTCIRFFEGNHLGGRA